MGATENISSWHNSCQRVHPKDKRSMSKHYSTELAKKERRSLVNDKELSKHTRFELERKDNYSIS